MLLDAFIPPLNEIVDRVSTDGVNVAIKKSDHTLAAVFTLARITSDQVLIAVLTLSSVTFDQIAAPVLTLIAILKP